MTPLRFRCLSACLFLLLLGGSGCSWFRRPEPSTTPVEQSDALVFDNVTLEQPNEQGEKLWKLRATRATYSPSGSQAKVMKPRGKLFQADQEIYEVEANEGEVNQDGEVLLLRGEVLVQDLRDGATLRADEAEWRPQEDQLFLRGNVVGTQGGLQVRANDGIWQDSRNEIRLMGQPVLTTLADQQLAAETAVALWQIEAQQISSEQPIAIRQTDATDPTQTTRRANAEKGQLNLVSQEVLLRQNARVNFVDPPMDISSDVLRWQPQADRVVSEARVTVTDRTEKITISGDRGDANLVTEIVEFVGNVSGVAELRQSTIQADRLKWNAKNQDVDAQGNVNYVQAEPALEVAGPSATGNLNDEFVVVSGGEVQTTIIPLDE